MDWLFIDASDIAVVVVIISCILLFFTRYLDTNVSHLTAIAVCVMFVVMYNEYKRTDKLSTISVIDQKLESLVDTGEEIPSFLYLDANIINIFYIIKYNFYTYSPSNYKKALDAANGLLKVKYYMELILDNPIKTPNLFENDINYEMFFSSEKNKACKGNILNTNKHLVKTAIKYLKKCMNYVHAFVYSMPHIPGLMKIHDDVSVTLKKLLQTVVNDIKKINDDYNKAHELNTETSIINNFNKSQPFTLPEPRQLENIFEYY